MGQWSLFARECWFCGEKLPIPKHGPGRNQRFCNNACKMKWYRVMKKDRYEKGVKRNGPETTG